MNDTDYDQPHIPECVAVLNESTWDGSCVCKPLAAAKEASHTKGFIDGYTAGMQTQEGAVHAKALAGMSDVLARVKRDLLALVGEHQPHPRTADQVFWSGYDKGVESVAEWIGTVAFHPTRYPEIYYGSTPEPDGTAK